MSVYIRSLDLPCPTPTCEGTIEEKSVNISDGRRLRSSVTYHCSSGAWWHVPKGWVPPRQR